MENQSLHGTGEFYRVYPGFGQSLMVMLVKYEFRLEPILTKDKNTGHLKSGVRSGRPQNEANGCLFQG